MEPQQNVFEHPRYCQMSGRLWVGRLRKLLIGEAVAALGAFPKAIAPLFRAHVGKIHKLAIFRAADCGSNLARHLPSARRCDEVSVRAAIADEATRFLANIRRQLLRLLPDLERDLGEPHWGVVFEAQYIKILFRM